MSWLTADGATQYSAHCGLISLTMPFGGGELQADGSWTTDAWWGGTVQGDYMPVATLPAAALAVLDDAGLRTTATNGLLALAVAGNWPGVYLDFEGFDADQAAELTAFHQAIYAAFNNVNLLVGVSVRGRTSDSGSDYDAAYTYDFTMLDDVADFIDLRCYGYWQPVPRAIGPLWYVQDCIEYALGEGIPASKLHLGLGNFSEYWPNPPSTVGREILSYDEATAMVVAEGSNATMVWADANGKAMERQADYAAGYIRIQDGSTTTPRLALIDQYELAGMALYLPGLGDESTWESIRKWKHRSRRYDRYRGQGMGSSIGSKGGFLVPPG